jgi:hypothetical protein
MSLLIFDKVISVLVLLSLNVSTIRADFMMMAVYLLLFPYMYLTDRKKAIVHIIISSIMACGWILIAKGQYGYNREFLVVDGYNIYPLFAWAVGLFGVYLIYAHWVPSFRSHSFVKKILLFTAFYWTLLLGSEILAYHVFNFRNVATASYAGLPLIDCIHVPGWMKAAYLLNGPLYFLVCEFIRLPDPHTRSSD